MSTPSARGVVLADSVLMSRQLLTRYLVGFNDVTSVRQTPDLPNHLAWSLGHLALTMHRAANLLVSGDATKPALPADQFITGDGFTGSRERGVYDTESIAFGSKPQERHDKFPRMDRCIEIFNAAVERLAQTARALPDAEFDKMHRWGQIEIPAWALVARMVYHNGVHTGQIADLRRALSFKSIFA